MSRLNAGVTRRLSQAVVTLCTVWVVGCASPSEAPAPAPQSMPPKLEKPSEPVQAAPAVVAPDPRSIALNRFANDVAPLLAEASVQMIRNGDGSVTLRAAGDVGFVTAKTTVSPKFKKFLEKLAAQLKAQPELVAIVTGHTDSTGQAQRNDALSLSRATQVNSVLTGAGVAASRLTAQGRGARDPLAGNDTAQGRAANRRVEITLDWSAP